MERTTVKLKDVSAKYYAKPFFHGNNNLNFHAHTSSFYSFLNTPLYFNSRNEYSYTNFTNQLLLLGINSFDISHCSFSNCCSGKYLNQSNGGAIMIMTSDKTISHITIKYCGFLNCRALSTGGAIYSVCDNFCLLYVCLEKCSAATGQTFFSVSSIGYSNVNLTTISNIIRSQNNYQSYNYGLIGGNSNIADVNSSKIQIAATIAQGRVRSFSHFEIKKSLFSNSHGLDHFNIAGENVARIKSSVIVNNSALNSYFVECSVIHCIDSIFIGNNCKLTPNSNNLILDGTSSISNNWVTHHANIINERLQAPKHVEAQCWNTIQLGPPARIGERAVTISLILVCVFCAVFSTAMLCLAYRNYHERILVNMGIPEAFALSGVELEEFRSRSQ